MYACVYDSGERDYVTFMDGKRNLSYALTKINPEMSIRLSDVLSFGLLDVRLDINCSFLCVLMMR